MVKARTAPTGEESPFGEHEIIVTKTDLKGRITYANDVFLRVSRYTSKQVIGQPHSIIRHPEMPRAIFKLLWDTLAAKEEIFAYVINLASNGDHYWVLAHVTPSFDVVGNVVGYHSNRRKPDPEQVAKIRPVYQELLREEQSPSSRKEGMLSAYDQLFSILKEKGVAYDEFVLAL
jgi:PAS domain S-box-containing protein